MLSRWPTVKPQARICTPTLSHQAPILGRHKTRLLCRSLPPSNPSGPEPGCADNVYRVTYDNVTREVSQSQLEKAPNSLLSKILLHGGSDKDSSGTEGDVQTRTFKVSYQNVTRGVTAEQLNKAADSALSKTLLQTEAENDAVVISSTEDATMPAWKNGSERLFQMCMDCYTGALRSSSSLNDSLPSARALKSAVVGYFKIPFELWPLGFHVRFTALDNEETMCHRAEKLLRTCAEIMKKEMRLGDAPANTCTDGIKVITSANFKFEKDRWSREGEYNVSVCSYNEPNMTEIFSLLKSQTGVGISNELKAALKEVAQRHYMEATFSVMRKGDSICDAITVMQLECKF